MSSSRAVVNNWVTNTSPKFVERPGKCGVIDRVSSRTTTVYDYRKTARVACRGPSRSCGQRPVKHKKRPKQEQDKMALLGTWPGFERTGRKTHTKRRGNNRMSFRGGSNKKGKDLLTCCLQVVLQTRLSSEGTIRTRARRRRRRIF